MLPRAGNCGADFGSPGPYSKFVNVMRASVVSVLELIGVVLAQRRQQQLASRLRENF